MNSFCTGAILNSILMPHASQYFVDKTEALIIDNALKRAIEESNQRLIECRNRSPNRYQPLLIKDGA